MYVGNYNGGAGSDDILTVNPVGGAVLRLSALAGGNWVGWNNY